MSLVWICSSDRSKVSLHFSFNLKHMIFWGQNILIYLFAFCFSYRKICEGVVITIMLLLWLSSIERFKEGVLSLRITVPPAHVWIWKTAIWILTRWQILPTLKLYDDIWLPPCVSLYTHNLPQQPGRGNLHHVWQKRHCYSRCATVNSTTNTT